MSISPPDLSDRIDRKKYYEMEDACLFLEMRVELIEGKLHRRPSPTPKEACSMGLLHQEFNRLLPEYFARSQAPLVIDDFTELEPDLALVPGEPRDYVGKGHPSTADLLIEVAETTLDFDRFTKSNYYASRGNLDYWIMNLMDNCVEVYRDPIADASAPRGYRYKSVTILKPPQAVSPLVKPQVVIPVADLLP